MKTRTVTVLEQPQDDCAVTDMYIGNVNIHPILNNLVISHIQGAPYLSFEFIFLERSPAGSKFVLTTIELAELLPRVEHALELALHTTEVGGVAGCAKFPKGPVSEALVDLGIHIARSITPSGMSWLHRLKMRQETLVQLSNSSDWINYAQFLFQKKQRESARGR